MTPWFRAACWSLAVAYVAGGGAWCVLAEDQLALGASHSSNAPVASPAHGSSYGATGAAGGTDASALLAAGETDTTAFH